MLEATLEEEGKYIFNSLLKGLRVRKLSSDCLITSQGKAIHSTVVSALDMKSKQSKYEKILIQMDVCGNDKHLCLIRRQWICQDFWNHSLMAFAGLTPLREIGTSCPLFRGHPMILDGVLQLEPFLVISTDGTCQWRPPRGRGPATNRLLNEDKSCVLKFSLCV